MGPETLRGRVSLWLAACSLVPGLCTCHRLCTWEGVLSMDRAASLESP